MHAWSCHHRFSDLLMCRCFTAIRSNNCLLTVFIFIIRLESHFHSWPYLASPSLECLKPQWAKQFWMVLMPTLHEISAINCTAYKRSVLALTSLAVDVGRFLELLQGCNLPTLRNIRFLDILWFPCPLDSYIFPNFHHHSTTKLVSHFLKISDVAHTFLLA